MIQKKKIKEITNDSERPNPPMPSGAASGGQKTVTPYQSRLNREAASEHAPIKIFKERLCVGCALPLLRKRKRFFRCPWRFSRRRFRRRLDWGFRRGHLHCNMGRERCRGGAVNVNVDVDVASDARLLFLRVGIRERGQRRERGERFHEAAGIFVRRTGRNTITIRSRARFRAGGGNPMRLRAS
jgi:hypothetical protein